MKREILTIVLPVGFAVCTSILQTPAAAETGTAATVKAERPTVKVGDKWKFACATGSQKSEMEWAVTFVDGSGIKGTENGKPLVLSADLNPIESPRRKDSDHKLLSFPLGVGKQWWNANNQWVDYNAPTGGTAHGTSKGRVTVVGYEKVQVRAGTFDAFKLTSTVNWTDNFNDTGTSDETYWYAPAAHAIVKSDYVASYHQETTCELVEFQLQP